MLSSSQRPAMRMHRTNMLSWLCLLSLALHVMLLVSLVMFPSGRPQDSEPEPLSVEIIAEAGPASAVAPPALAEAIGEPVTPAASIEQAETSPPPTPLVTEPWSVPSLAPVQQAVVPTPVPVVPPAPPLEQTDIPLPPVPTVVPDALLPPPARQVEATPPAPPSVPPSRPVAHPHPRAAPSQRPAARTATAGTSGDGAGPIATRSEGGNVAVGANSANNGAAWMGRLKQWWDQHSFYPREASQSDEGGSVRVRIVIAADGQVASIQVVQGSGSSALDAAALAVFRNAHHRWRKAHPRSQPMSW